MYIYVSYVKNNKKKTIYFSFELFLLHILNILDIFKVREILFNILTFFLFFSLFVFHVVPWCDFCFSFKLKVSQLYLYIIYIMYN